MTADLEAMKQAGIGNLVFLEVNVGVPRGRIDFLSEEWQELFAHAVHEAERLGIEMTLGVGPGWTGSGGPWVPAAQSMQHLVSSTIQVDGNGSGQIRLPLPPPKKPYFGEEGFTPALKKQWQDFYEDVAVLAFPTPATSNTIADIDEKALYYRAPYSSAPGVKPFLPVWTGGTGDDAGGAIAKDKIIDLTDKLQPGGVLKWEAPSGNWTIMRFGSRNNGAVTRPAPLPGVGFESDKFDTAALNAHLAQYTGKLLRRIGPRDTASSGGLKKLHMDSWEMGAQNWTARFREKFKKRRGYDPLPYYPVYAGSVVESRAISERFLWDLRQTSQELILENHVNQLRKYCREHGLQLSIEPYDMNPVSDLELGALADVPMCEFWSRDFGFNTAFSCIEATSLAHVNGKSLVAAEAFTGNPDEAWKQYPGSMKAQGDWAFAAGINRFVYHTFANQSLDPALRPGMTMGPYGVHWDRSQTWWPMVDGYHRYISRCQFMLQQGRAVADILYLAPEGAPHVFQPPASALSGDAFMPDRKGYNFDGCAPSQLYKATVKDHQIVFPGGASYRLLVLPAGGAITPALLEKVRSLVQEGAVVIGMPPFRSPGLSDFPAADQRVRALSDTLWGGTDIPGKTTTQPFGKGRIIWGGALIPKENSLYPEYEPVAGILQEMGTAADFGADVPLRYTHRTTKEGEMYFVANPTDQRVKAACTFRATNGAPALWDPLTGKTRALPEFQAEGGQTSLPLQFEPYQSFFIVFENTTAQPATGASSNFPETAGTDTLQGAWTVSFDTAWGGPGKITFDRLTDWTSRPEEGIKYYSGIALYQQRFDLPAESTAKPQERLYLDLGEVKHIARVRLNGKDLGVVWTAPWKVDITDIILQKNNQLEITVANLWPNRLIGDEQLPDDGIRDGRWPEWLLKGEKRTSGRYTFTTNRYYKKGAPLLKSGLLGPVTIQRKTF